MIICVALVFGVYTSEGPDVSSSPISTPGETCFGMPADQVRAQLRNTTTDTQKHYEEDVLANLRDAMKAVDFEG